MNDLIVVGGGLSGLAAATWCAQLGLRVVVLERAVDLGGRARTDLQSGYAHNLGGHALYIDGPAYRGLHDLGVNFTGAKPVTAGLLGFSRGNLHRFPAGPLSMLATDLFGFGAKVEATRALMALAKTDPAPLRDVSWSAWLAQACARPEVRDAISAIARVATYANAPGRASAGATIAQLRHVVAAGVLYLDGGWRTLVDGLERSALAAGVQIVRSAHVTSVIHDGSARGVSVAGEHTIAGRSVLVAAGPGTARALLRDESIGAGLIPTHAACLDLGLADLPCPNRLVVFGIDTPLYFSVHSASARLAERGATVHLMKYLDPDVPADAAGAERDLEALADCIQPGWRERVVVRRFLPNLVSSNALVAAGARRPALDAARVPGVYLTGDWVGEEGMLADAAIASARAVATRIAADLGRSDARMAAPAATMSTS
jgi:phytoene dehydrogenase-like protein